MRAVLGWLLLVAASPALAALTPDEQRAAVKKGAQLIGKDAQGAIDVVAPVIVQSTVMTPKPDTDYVCVSDMGDTIGKMLGAAARKRNAVAVADDVCAALFITGFALIDAGRAVEAEPYLRRATELEPLNSHYLNEYAEWFKTARQWQKSYDLFAQAAAMADQQPADMRAERHARSLRGMGFTLIELGRLDDAEARFTESLKLQPDNRGALSELRYIKEQRARIAAKPAS